MTIDRQRNVTGIRTDLQSAFNACSGRTGITVKLQLSDDETVMATLNDQVRLINIACDSDLAIIADVTKAVYFWLV